MNKYRLALFGDPVSRSHSPTIHQAFGRQFGLDIDYQLIRSNAGTFQTDLEKFRSAGGHGCNVTMPLKHEAFDLAATPSARAQLATAANTLWWDSDNRLNADNTDGAGLVRDIEHNLGISIVGKRILVLGAGGATSGLLGALLDCNPSKVIIANRTVDRARVLAGRHSAQGDVEAVSIPDLQDQKADIILDATSLGHNGVTPDVPEALLAGAQICYSINYGPAARALGNWCAALGVPFQTGLGMLVEQAACAFEIWTGLTPQTANVLKDLDCAVKQTGL